MSSSTADATAVKGGWSPLAEPLFRTLWIAAIVADTGIWNQDMTASWLMTSATTSPLLISLMQGAANLPYFLLAFPAGVLADSFNQRTMLMLTALFISVVSLFMGVLSFSIPVTPWMLLIYVFAIGAGNAFFDPVWKGVVPQLVKPENQTAAFGLDGVAVNIARSIGPTIAGILITVFSPSAAFAFNALGFLCFAMLLLRWTPAEQTLKKFSWSGFLLGIRTGLGFVRFSPDVLRILFRSFMFLIPGSVMWALLPLIGRQVMGLNAGAYGVLVGCVGLGAIIGVTLMSRLKLLLGVEKMLLLGSFGFIINLFMLGFVQRFEILCLTMPLAGFGWILTLANLQSSILPSTPLWVRGRVIALYSLTFFGSVSSGSILWGLLAEQVGLSTTLGVAAVLMMVTAILGLMMPLPKLSASDVSAAPINSFWAMSSHLTVDAEGPIVISYDYRVAPELKEDFMENILNLGSVRRRNGAYQWGIYEDIENTTIIKEQFIVSSRSEFQEANSRMSKADQEIFSKVIECTMNKEEPSKRYFRLDQIL